MSAKRMESKEAIYDEQIAPLMTQIIKVCKEHQLPMFATFCYLNLADNSPPDVAYCTSAILPAEYTPAALREAHTNFKRAIRSEVALLVVSGPSGSAKETP